MRDIKFLKELGGKVKSARMSKGLKVRELGKLCNTDYSNLSRFENGQVDIKILTLRNISIALNMDIKDFL